MADFERKVREILKAYGCSFVRRGKGLFRPISRIQYADHKTVQAVGREKNIGRWI